MSQSTLAPYLTDSSIVNTFLQAHTFSPGQTPKSFYLWSIITVLAAIVRDRFYFYKNPTHPMIPNLYTFLVAPSGVGKGTAINAACDYLRPYKDYLRMFVGRVNHASWIKYVTTPKGVFPELDNGRDPLTMPTEGFLVSEELGFSLPEGRLANEFLKMMTNAYTQTGREFEEMTVSSGYHRMDNPCFDWLAGTTDTWLLESVGISNILSGFASRTIWIIEEADMSKMCSWFVAPPGFEEMRETIKERIDALVRCPGGELILTPKGRFQLDKWYQAWGIRACEKGDSEKALGPLYARGHDLALKIAMLLRVADFDPRDPYRYAIKENEVLQATLWVENLMLVHYPRLLRFAYKSRDVDVEHADTLEEVIKGFPPGHCTRGTMMKKAHNRGLSAKAVDNALRSLMEQRKVEMVVGPGGKSGYYWWCGLGDNRERQGE